MLPRNHPDRIHVAFDDHRLVANADCSCRLPWPTIWVWVNWWTAMLTWEMRRVEPTRETRC